MYRPFLISVHKIILWLFYRFDYIEFMQKVFFSFRPFPFLSLRVPETTPVPQESRVKRVSSVQSHRGTCYYVCTDVIVGDTRFFKSVRSSSWRTKGWDFLDRSLLTVKTSFRSRSLCFSFSSLSCLSPPLIIVILKYSFSGLFDSKVTKVHR